eukprot:TRINITY_DN14663_c0_g1_i1.p1 TRINITY_DN14663_c0_g1~~TRINITY_DN14663_c0_g1_i1.p1  ORF type:complete len:160 (+),score=20.47 TRINITY_DN14663_c0_g1_i1:106-585(+)
MRENLGRNFHIEQIDDMWQFVNNKEELIQSLETILDGYSNGILHEMEIRSYDNERLFEYSIKEPAFRGLSIEDIVERLKDIVIQSWLDLSLDNVTEVVSVIVNQGHKFTILGFKSKLGEWIKLMKGMKRGQRSQTKRNADRLLYERNERSAQLLKKQKK